MITWNFDGFNAEEIEIFDFEIKIGNNIQAQKFQGSASLAQMQFMQLLQQTVNNQQPIRIRISKDEQIWSQFDKTIKTIKNGIQFANKPYMEAFPDEFIVKE